MNLVIAAVGAVVAALLETSVLPELRLAGIKPDLVFVLAVVSGVILGVEESLVWAFVGGLVLDVLLVRPVGSTILALLVVTGLAIAVARVVGTQRRLAAVVAVFALSWVFQVLLLAILVATAGLRVGDLRDLAMAVALVAVMNTAVAVVVAVIARSLSLRFGAADRLDW